MDSSSVESEAMKVNDRALEPSVESQVLNILNIFKGTAEGLSSRLTAVQTQLDGLSTLDLRDRDGT